MTALKSVSPRATVICHSNVRGEARVVFELDLELDSNAEAQTLVAVLDNDSEQLRRYAIQRLGIAPAQLVRTVMVG